MPRRRKVQTKGQENQEPAEKLAVISKKVNKAETSNKKQKLEPDWIQADGLKVVNIILSVQNSDCNANKCLTELTKVYRKVNKSCFLHWMF